MVNSKKFSNKDQYFRMEEVFLKNHRIRLLKQIILNYNNRKTENKEDHLDIIETILRVLYECKMVSKSFIQTNFPEHQKFLSELNTPISVKQKYLKTLENSLILEESLDGNQFINEEINTFNLNIDKTKFHPHNHNNDENAKFEFSSYTSLQIDVSFNAKNSPLLQQNSLENRLDHLNISSSVFKRLHKLNGEEFPKGNGHNENNKRNKNLWKSSF